jgi:hypothetical protein
MGFRKSRHSTARIQSLAVVCPSASNRLQPIRVTRNRCQKPLLPESIFEGTDDAAADPTDISRLRARLAGCYCAGLFASGRDDATGNESSAS